MSLPYRSGSGVALAAVVVAAFSCSAFAEERSNDWRWSFGGHARTMYESYRGLDFGLGPIEHDDWIHQRVQAMGTLEYRDTLQLATELTWGHMWGKESSLAPPDEDDGDFLQLYAQVRVPFGRNVLELRAGRQTLYYGSGRLLAAREGANQRLTHDALRLSWIYAEKTRVDAFIASPVQVESDAFDNRSEPDDVLLWSLYTVTPLGGENFADVYYIGLRDNGSVFATPGRPDLRHTLGLRNWNKDRPFIYNTELMVQFGTADGRKILAAAASVEVGYVFDQLPWKATPELRADVISGGDDGGTIHTFNPLFQANNYFNEGGFLAPANLYNLNPLLKLRPHESVQVSLGVNFQWLFSTRDSIYSPPLQRLGEPVAGGDRYIGTAFNASVEWEFTRGATVFLGYTHQTAGGALKAIGGRSDTYVQVALRWEF